MDIKPYAKAVVAGTVAFCGTLGTALADGVVTGVEWCGIVPATVIAVAAVFSVPNKDPHAEHQDESVQPPEHRGLIFPEDR